MDLTWQLYKFSHEKLQPSSVIMHIKTVILLGIFFHLVCVMLLICQQRFLFNVFYVFYFFHKTAFLTFFYSWGQSFLHLRLRCMCTWRTTTYYNTINKLAL